MHELEIATVREVELPLLVLVKVDLKIGLVGDLRWDLT